MTQFFVPPKNVRAPESLVGRKPLGPVEVDWTHPLSQGLVVCTDISPASVKDLVSGDTFALSGTPTFGIKNGGQAVIGGTADQAVIQLTGDRQIADDAPMSFVLIAAFDNANTTRNRAVRLLNTTAGSIYWVESGNGSTSDIYAGIFNGSVYSDNVLTQITAKKPYTYVNVFTGSNYISTIFDQKGQQYDRDALVVSTTGGAVDSVCLLSNSGSLGMEGCVLYFCLWNRALNRAEEVAIGNDPYQLLKPQGT